MKKLLIKLAYKIFEKYNINPIKIEKDKIFLFNGKFFTIVNFTYDEGIDRITSLNLTAYEMFNYKLNGDKNVKD